MLDRTELCLFVTIHGPNSEYLNAGDNVPSDWSDEYVETLVADGAAGVPTEAQLEQWSSDARIRASAENEINVVQTGVRG